MESKTCISCKQTKPLTEEFFPFRKETNSFRGICRECYNAQGRKPNSNEYIDRLQEFISYDKLLLCPICNLEQEPKEFVIKKGSKFIISTKCKTCYDDIRKVKQREYVANDAEKSRKINRKSYSKHRGRRRLEQREAYRKDKQKRFDSNYAYTSGRMKIDPAFKLRKRISKAIREAIAKSGSSKNRKSILQYLPYTMKALKLHLETLFEPWMNWNNYGQYITATWDDQDEKTWTWQIDHIIPQSMLLYSSMEDENFKKCWALENLRPYNSKLNLIEGVSRVRH